MSILLESGRNEVTHWSRFYWSLTRMKSVTDLNFTEVRPEWNHWLISILLRSDQNEVSPRFNWKSDQNEEIALTDLDFTEDQRRGEGIYCVGEGGAPSVQSEGAFLKVSRDLSISDDVMLEKESLDFAFSRYLPWRHALHFDAVWCHATGFTAESDLVKGEAGGTGYVRCCWLVSLLFSGFLVFMITIVKEKKITWKEKKL